MICRQHPRRGLAWSRSRLLHQRNSSLADFLKLHFKATKLLGAQIGEYFLHLPGMFPKGRDDEVLATRGEGNDSNPSVFGALDSADQPLPDKAIDSDTD